MKLSRRTTATAAALATVTLGATLAATAPASAAVPTASKAAKAAYNGVCGSGFKVIDSTPVGSVGTVYLTWNEAKGQNCAVTIRNKAGAKIYMSVTLEIPEEHNPIVSDTGYYTSYAGPVYLGAGGYCVNWSGAIGSATGADSGHCG
ncbi:spore-associated protein A [Streptomyces violaceus]